MRVLWILVCSCCCFTQICILVAQYMKYDMTTSVEFTFPELIHLPSITFSTVLLGAIDWRNEKIRSACAKITGIEGCDQLAAKEIERRLSLLYYDENYFPLSSEIMSRFTIPDILNNMVLPFDSIVSSHRRYESGDVFNRMTTFKNMSESFDISIYLDDAFICYKLVWKPDLRIRNYWQITRAGRDYAKFYFDADKAAQVKIMYISYNGVDSEETKDEITLPTNPGKSYSSYDYFESKFLPAPFATNCCYYKSESTGKHSNRMQCYKSCFRESCLKKLGKKPVTTHMTASDNSDEFFDSASYAKHEPQIRNLSLDCDKICSQQDCVQSVYVPRLKSTAGNRTRVDVTHAFYLPSSPSAMAQSIARISMESFITDLLSTSGFWLGLSALDVIRWSASLLIRFLGKKRKSKRAKRKRDKPSIRLFTTVS